MLFLEFFLVILAFAGGLFLGRRSKSSAIEEALKDSEEKFRTLAENAHAAFGIIQGARFVYANRYFAEMSGYSVEEILTMNFNDMVHPDFQPMISERAARRQRGEDLPTHYEFRMVTKSGVPKWVDLSPAAALYRGRPAIIGTGFDITERKEIETRFLKAKEAAESASAVKDHFLAVLSHELRTPLTPVLAALSILQRAENLTRRQAETIEIARRNIDLEVRLIDDLLDLTRINQGKISLDLKRVKIEPLISSAMEICRSEIEDKELQLSVSFEDSPHTIDADPRRIQQVLWNVLKNAIKFTPSQGRITVRSFSQDGQVNVEIADTGAGFDPAKAERLFKPFEQADRDTAQRFGGLGLGLAISRSFVEMHSGVISAKSAGPGKGATFCITLPVVQGDLPEGGHAAAIPQNEKILELQILLVEDNSDTAHLIALALESMGHRVKTAENATTALRLAGVEHFDLLISDLGLPDRSGVDLLKDIRASGNALKAIALTGFGQEEDVRRTLEAGFAQHLTKPVDLEVLETALRKLW